MSYSTLRVVPATEFKQGPEVYSMTRNPRGSCIIISNNDVDSPSERMEGSELDVRRMEDLFRQLHFQVTVMSNVSTNEIKHLLRQVAKAESQRDADCLVVVLMLHSAKGTPKVGDGEKLHLPRDIYHIFNNENCPALLGKPKLFFVQAYRGAGFDNESDNKSTTEDVTPAAVGDSSAGTSRHPRERTPLWTDMYIACATIPCYVAPRDQHVGSRFLSAVSEVFSEHACTTSLDGLMHHVHKKVMQCCAHDGSRDTFSTNMIGWMKKLYFNPGLYVH